MMKKIKLSRCEKQCGISRVQWAEGLIKQLPKEHDGRNSWLLNYGTSDEAKEIRGKRGILFDGKTASAIYRQK